MTTLLLLLSLAAIITPTTPTTIGITYSSIPGSFSDTALLSVDGIAEKVVSMKIQAVRLPDSNPAMIRAFANTNVSLCLSVPNPLVQSLASSRSVAIRWVNHHVLRFYPRTRISIISVGNDAKSDSQDVSPFLLRAMENVQDSLTDLKFYEIAVSTTFSFFNIVPAALPSLSEFQNPKGEVIIKPILEFLQMTNSSFLISFYPCNVHWLRYSALIELAFHDSPVSFVDDISNGIRYHNVWDFMVGAVINSMAVLGHENIPVIVAEIGWAGEVNNAAATRFGVEMIHHYMWDPITDAVISFVALMGRVMGHKNIAVISVETGLGSSEIDAGEVYATDLNIRIFLEDLLTHLKSGVSLVSQVYFTDLELELGSEDPRVSSTTKFSDPSILFGSILFGTAVTGLAISVVFCFPKWLPKLEQVKKVLEFFLKIAGIFKGSVSFYNKYVADFFKED